MWDAISKGFGSAGNWLSKGENLQGLGSFVGAAGSIYGGLKMADIAQDNLDFQKTAYNDQWSEQLNDKKKKQAAYDASYKNSLGSYGSTTGVV